MERKDFLRQGGPCFYFDTELFAPTTDSFALGWFAVPKRGERVCDLGSGTGLLGTLLLAREPSLTLFCVEQNAAANALAEKGFAENGWGGLVAQGLGTSMLQMGNIVKNPCIWLPPTLAAAITGPVATCIFRLENGIAIASGMGTCGLVGPIGILSWDGFGGAFHWLGLILVCFVLPAVLTPLIALPMRRLGWIKPGDCKLDL